jgi:hypothetical protein
MEYQKQAVYFNKLKRNRLELEEPLNQRVITQKGLTKAITDHAKNNNWEMLKSCLVALNDNTNQLFDIMDNQREVFDAILKLLEELMEDKMYLRTLAVYRDFITDFVDEVEEKLGNGTWILVRNTIRKKRNSDDPQYKYSKEQLVFISMLEEVLKDVNMSVTEFELLMAMKEMSNNEFHKGGKRGRRKVKEVKSQLEKSFPNDLQLQIYKVPLRKLLDAHEIWRL